MNLQQPNGNDATQTSNRSRSVVPQSGLCARCVDGCRGNCKVFQSTFRGREVIYPAPFGDVITGADKNYPVNYSHLNIHGYTMGTKGLGVVQGTPDTAIFPIVNTETGYGWNEKVRMKVPVFTGALGSTDIARKNWDSFPMKKLKRLLVPMKWTLFLLEQSVYTVFARNYESVCSSLWPVPDVSVFMPSVEMSSCR